MKLKLLLIGLGSLGGTVLELLAREGGLAEIVVGGRNPTRGVARCNLARLGAIAQGRAPSIRFTPLDLKDREQVITTVQKEAPDIIFSSASMQTWWLADVLPPEAAGTLKQARFGVWVPIHLALTRRLMEALRDAGYRGITLSAPFPDAVNCILGKHRLAPTCGVGNLDEIVPKVRLLAAERLGAPLQAIRVVLVAHHALERAVFEGATGEVPPYFLRIYGDGKDVTGVVEADELLLAPYPLPSGPLWSFLTAGSVVRLVHSLCSDEETALHAPGPYGLPGGYPILVRRGAIRLAPIEGLSPEEAIAINERSHPFDGIERIEADGTVVFCPADVEVLRRTLGYDCPHFQPDEAEERAEELIARFREYAARQGVDVERFSSGVG